ncbi:MAG: M1 family metallopeptidase [Gemmatimonadota bacterium]|nr:M1 family metallopeptidase [Gemmatimonadota bacterium]
MILGLLLALQGPLAVRPDTIRPHHDALHHDITILLGDTGTHIVGVVQTTWRLASAEPVEVALDPAFRVVRVLTDGEGERRLARITFAVNPGGGVYIPHKKQAGDTLKTSIRYHGPVADGLIIRTDASGRRSAFADNWPDRAHRWLPLVDHPSDKATVALHIEVPPGMQVIGNGVRSRVDTLPRGRTMWHFELDQPIPPYGIVFGAGRLTTTALCEAACTVKCVPVDIVTYPEDSAWALEGPFRRSRDMVEYFSALVGPFPYDRLSHVQSTTIFGGAENPTVVFYDEKAYRNQRLGEQTVAHETAHQWFGDAVTEADWHHLWLSEGFATYYAALWIRQADGDSAFRAVMARNAQSVMKSDATMRPILDTLATDLMGLLNSNNYPKGAWVLHSLRGVVGDSAYHRGIREWYGRYRHATALSSDFAAVMAEAADADLTWYFEQALLRPGYPRLEVRWRRKGRDLRLDLRQVQPAEWGIRRLPGLELEVDGRRVVVDVTGAETSVTLAGVRGDPKSIRVDPDGWWLMESTVEKSR